MPVSLRIMVGVVFYLLLIERGYGDFKKAYACVKNNDILEVGFQELDGNGINQRVGIVLSKEDGGTTKEKGAWADE